MDQIILFGDSITQQSTDQSIGFVLTPALQTAYIRRLDVVNRGYSGYNTDQALHILPRLIKSPSCGRIRIFSIFFGANDSRLPNTGAPEQNVPLDRFKKNLADILDSVKFKPHEPSFVLITPPPVDERKFIHNDKNGGYTGPKRRVAETTAAYAQAVRDLGQERKVAVVDLWTAMLQHAGWDGDTSKPLPGSTEAPVNTVLQRLLPDGLHFSGETYEILYGKWIEVVSAAYPDLSPSALSEPYPLWGDAGAWAKFKVAID